MAKIRKTKQELKAQRDALKRFQKYLPTLELKKQQLRVEVNRMNAAIEAKRIERDNLWDALKPWVRLFAERSVDLEALVSLDDVLMEEDNVAGVNVPVFKEAVFAPSDVDLFATPPWTDEGVRSAKALVRLELELRAMTSARDRLAEELRITSQRVNLFERVKIPECQENIRVIRIALGDEQAAAVARAKTSKQKVEEIETATR